MAKRMTDRVHKYLISEYVCDNCRKVIGDEHSAHVPINVDCFWYDYGDQFGDDYDFCSIDCLLDHIKHIDPEHDLKIRIDEKLAHEFLDSLKTLRK